MVELDVFLLASCQIKRYILGEVRKCVICSHRRPAFLAIKQIKMLLFFFYIIISAFCK